MTDEPRHRLLRLAPLAAIALTAAALLPATRTSWGADDPYILGHLRSHDWGVRLFAYNVDRPSRDAGAWWDGVRYQRRFIRILPSALMAAEVAVLEQRPQALHLVSLALHLLNALLVYRLARRWLGHEGKAALVAMVYGVHPVVVEPVGWFALQPLIISATFCLAAVECWVRYRLGEGRVWLWAALAAVVGALASYEATVVLPLLLVLGDAVLLPGRQPRGGSPWRPRLAVLSLLIPFLTFSVLIRSGASALETSYRPSVQTIWRVARMDLANYFFKALGLINPKTPGQYSVYNALGEPLALVVLAAILLPILWWARRRPLAVLGVIAFMAFLGPPWLIRSTVGALNIPSLRQVYLPLLGLAAVITEALVTVRFRTAAAIVVPVIAAFVALDQVPRGGPGSGGAAAASVPVQKALAGIDPARPVIVVGSFTAPKRPGCGYELSLDWPGRAELRLVPPARSGAAPRLARTGERTFTASAPDGLLLPLDRHPMPVGQARQTRYNSGGFRITVEPPLLVREGRQQLEGATVEIVARDAEAVRTLLFTLDRPLDEYTFLAAEGCKEVRLATFELVQ